MNPSDIRHLFDYTEWANRSALDAADKLSDEQLRHDFHISHGSILGTLLHMAGAEWIWLERWQGRTVGPESWAAWKVDNCPHLATLRTRWQEIIDRRATFILGLNEDRLNADSPFKLLNGVQDSLPLVGQMQHVVNHATLHRGQVVGMIRQLGIAPPSTDLIFYLRTKRKEMAQ
jgi:uncharacterized damage-inducible protein DinB